MKTLVLLGLIAAGNPMSPITKISDGGDECGPVPGKDPLCRYTCVCEEVRKGVIKCEWEIVCA